MYQARAFATGMPPQGHVRSHRIPAIALLLGLLAAVLVLLAGGAQASPAPVVSKANISGLGVVLVSGHRAVYVFTHDPKGHSTCTGSCAARWSPVIVSTSTAHHLGHVHGLGTIHRAHGKLQLAIHGHPLYFNKGDHSVTRAKGQGYEDAWFVVRPNGTIDRALVSTSIAAPNVPAGTAQTSTPASSTTSTSKPTTSSRGTATTQAPAAAHSSTPTTSARAPATTNPPATTTTSPPATSPPATTTTSHHDHQPTDDHDDDRPHRGRNVVLTW